MNITIDAAVASILSAFVVGVITVLTTIIANRNSYRQQKMQLDREDRRAEREEKQADLEREVARKEDLDKKLLEIYGNAIASLTTLRYYTDSTKRNDSKYLENLAEVQKWLSMVAIYHWDKGSDEYAAFLQLFSKTQDSFKGYPNIEPLREMSIKFASNDPRLHS